jgi:hypothetical protein
MLFSTVGRKFCKRDGTLIKGFQDSQTSVRPSRQTSASFWTVATSGSLQHTLSMVTPKGNMLARRALDRSTLCQGPGVARTPVALHIDGHRWFATEITVTKSWQGGVERVKVRERYQRRIEHTCCHRLKLPATTGPALPPSILNVTTGYKYLSFNLPSFSSSHRLLRL